MRDLPAGGALEGAGQQFVHETGHRLTPGPGLMVESAHHTASDAGRVMSRPRHLGGVVTDSEGAVVQIYIARRRVVLQSRPRLRN